MGTEVAQWGPGAEPPEAEDVLRINDIRMDSGKRFKAFTILTVTCRFAMTVTGFVESQSQK